jgi:hypothetical protein
MIVHAASYGLLALVSCFVYFNFFRGQSSFRKYGAGIYSVCYLLLGLAGALFYLGFSQLDGMLNYAFLLANTLGAISMLMICWGVINPSSEFTVEFYSILIIGITLLLLVSEERWKPVQLIVPSICVISAMLVGCLGLIRQLKSGLWVVFAMMAMALATKVHAFNLPFHPIDAINYLTAFAIYCVGKAVEVQNRKLFAKS